MNRFIKGLLNEGTLFKVKKTGVIADKPGIPMAQLALAWALRQQGVASAPVGTSRPEQAAESAKASGYVPTEEILREIEEALR